MEDPGQNGTENGLNVEMRVAIKLVIADWRRAAYRGSFLLSNRNHGAWTASPD
jgi:hypothetical protein